jgi:hypothetical protein
MVFGSAESGTPVPSGTGVLGRVTDTSGAPVAMATLTASPDRSAGRPVRQEANVSDADGWFFLPLPAGGWTVSATALGYRAASVAVEVADGQVHHDLVLVRSELAPGDHA